MLVRELTSLHASLPVIVTSYRTEVQTRGGSPTVQGSVSGSRSESESEGAEPERGNI